MSIKLQRNNCLIYIFCKRGNICQQMDNLNKAVMNCKKLSLPFLIFRVSCLQLCKGVNQKQTNISSGNWSTGERHHHSFLLPTAVRCWHVFIST